MTNREDGDRCWPCQLREIDRQTERILSRAAQAPLLSVLYKPGVLDKTKVSDE